MSYNTSTIDFIGYASAIAGYDIDAQFGAQSFYAWVNEHISSISPVIIEENASSQDKVTNIKNSLTNLAKTVADSVARQRQFAVIGGDHSSGIGTWSGVANQLQAPFSLIWVDAHMDAHTIDTSPSKNIHGMPIAHLLGKKLASLHSISQRSPALMPQHLFLIGVRSYEREEALFLKKQGVRIYLIEEVMERGIHDVLKEVLNHCRTLTSHYGFSIDVDAFDAAQMPGTGLHVGNGICVQDFLHALLNLDLAEGLLGVEIAEYSPHRDVNFKTASMMYQMLNALLINPQSSIYSK